MYRAYMGLLNHRFIFLKQDSQAIKSLPHGVLNRMFTVFPSPDKIIWDYTVTLEAGTWGEIRGFDGVSERWD